MKNNVKKVNLILSVEATFESYDENEPEVTNEIVGGLVKDFLNDITPMGTTTFGTNYAGRLLIHNFNLKK